MSARFVPFASFIDATFWNELNRLKLNEWRLDETPKDLKAAISLYDSIGSECRLSFGHESLDTTAEGVAGVLYLMNTVESFKSLNRKTFLQSRGMEMWNSIKNGEWLDNPEILWKFSMTIFADLKKYQYYYWNCCPGIVGYPSELQQTVATSDCDVNKLLEYYNRTKELVFLYVNGEGVPLTELKSLTTKVEEPKPSTSSARGEIRLPHDKASHVNQLMREISVLEGQNQSGQNTEEIERLQAQITSIFNIRQEFGIDEGDEPMCIDEQSTAQTSKGKPLTKHSQYKIVVADPSPVNEVVGWPVRNVLAAVAQLFPSITDVSVISLKSSSGTVNEFKFSWTPSEAPEQPSFSGWESNGQGKLAPRFVDMRDQFDPKRLMDQAVALNLSLIKWRLVPEMKLERLQNLKVLIFGAGTLGCNIARNLLGYNVKTISFIDNSTVSFSNPVRQSLSKFSDAQEGRGKAETAVAALKEIYPSVDAHGYNITVPMPGHSIGENGYESLSKDIELLEDLVQKHDVLFLALDSREARWLPTVLANKHKKMAYSVALGFDTYVVIRHGVNVDRVPSEGPPSCAPGAVIPYSELACYFCSDVTAPGNSTADRTLDQQCTVSRPGLSPIAAGVAVELMSSVLQHENMFAAPANIGEPDDSSTAFGATPHQIRGFIFKFQQMTPCVRRFEKCVGCGDSVLSEFEQKGWEFVKEVMNSPAHLEKISGLDQIHNSVADIEIDFSDSDSVVSL